MLARSHLLIFAIFILPVSPAYAGQSIAAYTKDGLSFAHPANWIVEEDLQFPGTRRSVLVNTPNKSQVTIEMYLKDNLTFFPEYRHYKSSLEEFAKRFKNRDITAKLQRRHSIDSAFIKRQGMEGLKDIERVEIGDLVDVTVICEFYRVDTKDEIVFITLDTNKDEYKATTPGFDTILKTFKYH